MTQSRIVCHFSCGAASAVATKLALADYGHARVIIFNAFIKEEDSDNRRFLADCERWFDHPVTVLRDTKYGASVREVWRRKGFIMNGHNHAAGCSVALKRDVIEAACTLDDNHVYGFTADEQRKPRVVRFLDTGGICPLIQRNLSHADCLGMIERAGIALPRRYLQGYNNANCVGCCKGGEGYWNKTRIDSPEDFAEVAEIQRALGDGASFFRNRETGERISLYQLEPTAGRHVEPIPDCSLFCSMAEEEFA